MGRGDDAEVYLILILCQLLNVFVALITPYVITDFLLYLPSTYKMTLFGEVSDT